MQKLKDDEVCKNNSGIFGVKSSFLIEYHKIFDFTSLKNLKILVCGANDFIQLKDTLLEKVIIYNSYSSTTKLIEKLISIKTLKEISLVIDEIKENKINKINDINTSVIDLKLYIYKSCDILSIQNKFPNLQKLSVSNLFIDICNTGYSIPRFEKKINISIEENSNSKINKLYLTIGDASFVSLYIPFENLTEIKLHGLINFNDFPIFQKNCNTIFKSLIYFECKIISDNRFDFLKYSEDFLNIFENINCMPNLKIFIFKSFISLKHKEDYLKIIKKLLSMNLIKIVLNINYDERDENRVLKDEIFDDEFEFDEKKNEKYSIQELKSIYADIDDKFINEYEIDKFDDKDDAIDE